MQRLKCEENKCRNNYCCHCVKDVIQISSEAHCKSFDCKTPLTENQAKREFEFACDTGLSTKKDMHHILCNEENCNYWNFGECASKAIKVDKKPTGAKCMTFTPKNKY